jgi:hypothetical protein
MTSSVSNDATTMILKEIDIEMRKEIVKIKREAGISLQTKASPFELKQMGHF